MYCMVNLEGSMIEKEVDMEVIMASEEAYVV
jgi:hypothetical protein